MVPYCVGARWMPTFDLFIISPPHSTLSVVLKHMQNAFAKIIPFKQLVSLSTG